ncbi:hypothetical protein DV735_g2832, partial [Chaetothyriales sp. CBS 134920]
MPAPYIPTPRTTDASYLSTGLERLGEMSPEKSFVNPQQGRDLITQMRSTRHSGSNQKTPRNGSRDPLRLLPNGNQGKSEFTPLMKSGVKNNMARRLSARRTGGIETPAYLRNGYVEGKTPGLPKLDDMSHLQSENTSSSAGNPHDYTPMPKVISSSAHSTPLAQLPQQDIGGVVNDGNIMTLREQENIINKIEKENFGLKMKIIFLESALSKRGAEFNQAALKENTDLKVNRVTMQRELHKLKKNIAQAERDAETYRLQLEEYRERIRRKHVDETVRVELENLRSELKNREKEIARFEEKQQADESGKDAELRRLRDEIEDLQAELREKDREIDSRDDELDQMKANASRDSNASAELEDELETVKQQVAELKHDLERSRQHAAEARAEQEEAMDEKRKAEENLAELQDEVANKSFTTRGMSRQLEEKVSKLEDELEELSARHADAQQELQLKEQNEKRLQERVRDLEREGASDSRSLQQQLELAQQQRATFERKLLSMTKQAEAAERDLQIKIDEKDLLQTRHDALTTESAQLQADLAKARKSIHELELALDVERQRSGQQDNVLRTQHQHELEQLNEQIDALHRDLNSQKNEHAADIEEFEAKRKSLESAIARAEEKANGLQRTVDKLQEAQGTLSGREMMLQEAVESEKQRHQQEEKVLSKQIEELNDDLAAKRLAAESNRTELNNAKEELRISIREQAALKEKVAELEEEIEVLQADMEQEHELVEQYQKKSNENADAQVVKLKREKQGLQESLATTQTELQTVRRELQVAEAEREELEGKLARAQKSADDTFNVDSEKRELSRAKQKLEKEVERLKSERDSLQASNDALEDEINREVERAGAEEDRLNAELDRIRLKQLSGTESRERDLRVAKNKADRLESRVKELEDLLENQSRALDGPVGDLSGLQTDLDEARKREAAAIKKETELKAANRDLKMKVNDLERELHEARLSQLKSRSPSASPPNQKELAQLRQQLVEARAEIKELKLQVSASGNNTQTGVGDLSVHLAVRESEVKEMKRQLLRLRDERKAANDKADAAESELEILQSRYEHMLEKMSSGKHSKDEIRSKEIKGFIKEITWLKAKCRREERLRKDIAFSKKYLEQGEAMRVQCNQIDLRILREMGIEIDKAKYQTRLKPIQKFRAGVFAVIAAIRMSDMEEQWRGVKKLGDELHTQTIIPLETSSGEVIEIAVRSKAEAQSYEAIIADRSKTKEGRAKRAYYGIDIHRLVDEARLQRHSSSGQAATAKAATSKNNNNNNAHLLWTEKYRARKFTELVGDERTHRQVLRWLKAWDPIVFPASCRRAKTTSTRIYHDDKSGNSSNGKGDANNSHRKLLLLTGPPGLGKTTLAHVCARQAGYEVLEINASDDRSRDVVRGRIKDALGTETVRGIQEPGKERKIGRPVCVVVDEVDGVVAGSGASGEGGFMKALVDLVQLDQRNLAYHHNHNGETEARKRKKGDRFRMLRPLILVCNDVYAPSLRALRTSGLAEIVHVRKPALEKVVARLKNVFEQEHIPCDTDAVRRICASAWGLGSRSSSSSSTAGGAGEGDIRGVLVNAEWIAHKFRARNASSSDRRPRLTRNWVDSHLAAASASSTSASTSSAKGLGRGGVREVIDRIFIDGAGLPNLSGNRLSADDARLVAESKSTSIGISDLRKRAAIAHLREMIDQCGEYDRVMTDCFATYPLQVYQDDVQLTKPNKGYDWLHFHDLMSSRVYSAHEWELLPYLNTAACGFHDLFASVDCGVRNSSWGITDDHPGKKADFAANEAEKANRTLLAELQDRFQAELLRMFSSMDNIATELVPHVESEKRCVRTCVKVMHALDVRFERVKVELEVGGGGAAAAAGHIRGGFAYRMEPPLDTLTTFHLAKGAPSAPVRYAVRQVLDQELRKEKAVQAALSRQARGARGARVWVSFHEGFSNAVRKPITLKELMEGFA